MSRRAFSLNFVNCVCIVGISLLLAACGGGDDSSSTAANVGGDSAQSGAATATDANAMPTMPAPETSFTSASQQSVLTDTTSLLQTTETTTTTDTAVAGGDTSGLGERAYTKNKCADCHGAKGEGVADKGKAIAGTALSFDDFDKQLRTGGGLGNDHIFGRSAVSPTGMQALYEYVKGLK